MTPFMTCAHSALQFPAFHELDKYFPISYIWFIKYVVDLKNQHEYEIVDGSAYDANIIVNASKLEPMVRAGKAHYVAYRSRWLGHE